MIVERITSMKKLSALGRCDIGEFFLKYAVEIEVGKTTVKY